MDSDPVLGSDALMRHIILALDGARQHVTLQSCAASCRRVWRAIKFAFIHAKGQYPVKLIKVTRVARARAYTFATSSGETFTLRGNDVPVRFQEEFGRRLLEPESRECQVKPRVGRLLQFSSRSQSMSCRAQWQRAQKARRSGGVLAAVKECQVVAALKLVYTHESPTGVYFFLAELLGSFAERECVDLKMLSRKQRLCFLRRCFSLVWYDCACTLKRFIRGKARARLNKVSRTLSKLRLVVDKFHFRKGHAGCRPGGTHPLKAVWPSSHAARFPSINDSAAEQAFAFVRRVAVAARRMTPVRGLLFITLMQHVRNLHLEVRGRGRKHASEQRSKSFRAYRRYAEAAEGLPFRKRARERAGS
ncbi:unnamed protein product [Effrenium voratum]|uniref:Uncharacterized protein n=1 Tax=Effrenium voratum TaxID=2562239 RepID=A0AA36IN84_9DINO|nr:unnamed protein product [Effrenium voratum]